MFSKKKLAALITSAALISIALAACGGPSDETADGKVTLTLWQPDTREAWGKSLDYVIDSFEDAYPDVTIENVAVPWAEINTKIQAARVTDTLPDLMYGWGGMLSSWAWSGVSQPSDDVIDEIGRDQFPEAILKDLQVDGKTYGVPVISYPQILWYRADMFKAAGISDPSTWTSWTDVSAAAKTLTDGDQYGFATFNKAPEPEILQGLMGTNDTSTFGPDGDVVIDNEKAVEALTFLAELNSYSPAGSMANAENDTRLAFTEGCCGMMISSSSMAGVIASNPDLLSQIKGAQFPTNNGDRGLLNSVSSIAVSSTTEHVDIAKAFLEHWLSEDIYLEFSKQTELGFLPVTSAVSESSDYWSSERIAPITDSLKAAVAASHIAVAQGQTFGPNKCSAKALSSGIWEAMGDKVTIGNEDPAAVAKWAQSEFTTLCDG